MIQFAAFRHFRFLLSLGLGLLTLMIATKSYLDYQQSHERGRLVVSIIREQKSLLAQLPEPHEDFKKNKGWPDDYMALQSWLILQLAKNAQPAEADLRLSQVSDQRSYSPVLKASLDRWSQAFQRWEVSRSIASQNLRTPEQLMEEARTRHFEATGFYRIGRMYDATALYLWSIELLSNFIESNPLHRDVPEALYLLGAAYFRFRGVIPNSVRSDRILNLCSEVFPETIWSERARAIWRNGVGRNGI